MSPAAYIPANAPFTAEQRAWLNGYLAGVLCTGEDAAKRPETKPLTPLTVLYGSQTGTAERIAKALGKEAGSRGFEARVLEASSHASVNWKSVRFLILVTSTWGNGEPPDNAGAFWTFLNSPEAPSLAHLSYGVLALGDRNYSDFCGAGRKFDERLTALGGQRVLARVDCDLDYEAAVKAWTEAVLAALEKTCGASGALPTAISEAAVPAPAAVASPNGWSRANPFGARLKAARRLNGDGSAKETRHIEISLAGSALTYETGDALGVFPTNCPALVQDILGALGCDGEEAVKTPDGSETSLRNALSRKYQITAPSTDLLRAVAERANDAELNLLLAPVNKAALEKHLHGREVIDFLVAHPQARFTPAEFVATLRPLGARLYSIASSLKAHPEEVHLCVGIVRYEAHGRSRKGVCSTYLADRVDAQVPLPIFVQQSHGFRLPLAGETPVIMVGPGTGIAPFRAFLEERRATAAPGKSWLFFGDQKLQCDFLYREELEANFKDGLLTRLDLAFSRDQEEKVYVQHRMLEQARELYGWLEAGAHFYVCGDAKRMAKDVDAALHQVIQAAGEKSPEAAAEYVANLRSTKRYQRDVY